MILVGLFEMSRKAPARKKTVMLERAFCCGVLFRNYVCRLELIDVGQIKLRNFSQCNFCHNRRKDSRENSANRTCF